MEQQKLTSTVFGSSDAKRQPPYQSGDVNFGLLRYMDNVDVRATCHRHLEPAIMPLTRDGLPVDLAGNLDVLIKRFKA